MEIILIITLTLIIVALIVLAIFFKRKVGFRSDIYEDDKNSVPANERKMELNSFRASSITIPIEQLPATTKIEEKSLFEITDSKVIARISETIPNAAEAVAKTITNKALKNVEIIQSRYSMRCYSHRIKTNGRCSRGFYRGTKGIKGKQI